MTVGIPDTITRGFTNVGCACPACEHITVAPWCSKNPGINNLSSVFSVPICYVMISAPSFTVTAGPTIVMDAPLPF